MTVCAIETATGGAETGGHRSFVIAADGSYGARLTTPAGEGVGPEGMLIPERWTLDGPEPYTVPLPGTGPESADSRLLPLSDGRVLIARRREGRHELALIYPTGPDTGELPLSTLTCEQLTLLPPTPGGRRAYALVVEERSTTVWLVAGGDSGPEQVARVPGRCSGGAWLDPAGRLLALDRTWPVSGTRPRDHHGPHLRSRTKTVAVDLERGGEVTPLLQITEESDDRLLLADPDSGLLIVRSNAPGEERLGWGVLGSRLPIRFPEALRPDGARLTPFAVQPGQVLLPESCGVALRVDGPNGTWLAAWRPTQRTLRHIAAPDGWLTGTGLWTAEGELRLPFTTAQTPCGLARLPLGAPGERQGADDAPPGGGAGGAAPRADAAPEPAPEPFREPFRAPERAPGPAPGPQAESAPEPVQTVTARPVPLQQAPLAGTLPGPGPGEDRELG